MVDAEKKALVILEKSSSEVFDPNKEFSNLSDSDVNNLKKWPIADLQANKDIIKTIFNSDIEEKKFLINRTLTIDGNEVYDLSKVPISEVLKLLSQIQAIDGFNDIEKEIVRSQFKTQYDSLKAVMSVDPIKKAVEVQNTIKTISIVELLDGTQVDTSEAKIVFSKMNDIVNQQINKNDTLKSFDQQVKDHMNTGIFSWVGDIINHDLNVSQRKHLTNGIIELYRQLQQNPNPIAILENVVKVFDQVPPLKKAMETMKLFMQKVDLQKSSLWDGKNTLLHDPLLLKKTLDQLYNNPQASIDFKLQKPFSWYEKSSPEFKELQKYIVESKLWKEQIGLLDQVTQIFDQFKEKQKEFKDIALNVMADQYFGWKEALVSIGLWDTFKDMTEWVMNLMWFENGFEEYEQEVLTKKLNLTEKEQLFSNQAVNEYVKNKTTPSLFLKKNCTVEEWGKKKKKQFEITLDKNAFEKSLTSCSVSLKSSPDLLSKIPIEYQSLIDAPTQLSAKIIEDLKKNLSANDQLLLKLIWSNTSDADLMCVGISMLLRWQLWVQAYQSDVPILVENMQEAIPTPSVQTVLDQSVQYSSSDLEEIDLESITLDKTNFENLSPTKNKEMRNDAKFKTQLDKISTDLWLEKPEYLYTVMVLESGVDSKKQNSIGATGLIQFLPNTAAEQSNPTGYKKIIDELKELLKDRATNKDKIISKKQEIKTFQTDAINILKNKNAVEQLDDVKKYLMPYKDKLWTGADQLGNLYMAVFYPKFIWESKTTSFSEKVAKANPILWPKAKDGELTIQDVHTTIIQKHQELW